MSDRLVSVTLSSSCEGGREIGLIAMCLLHCHHHVRSQEIGLIA